jgi:hypothetical protein
VFVDAYGRQNSRFVAGLLPNFLFHFRQVINLSVNKNINTDVDPLGQHLNHLQSPIDAIKSLIRSLLAAQKHTFSCGDISTALESHRPPARPPEAHPEWRPSKR